MNAYLTHAEIVELTGSPSLTQPKENEMTKAHATYRQGDVLLVAIDVIPEDAIACAVAGDVVLAYGEATGHAHRLAPENVRTFAKGGVWAPAAERFIQVVEGAAQLRHEEHATVALPPGMYRVVQQREYHPSELRNVAD